MLAFASIGDLHVRVSQRFLHAMLAAGSLHESVVGPGFVECGREVLEKP
jgi:hypothetical protein